MEKICGNCLLYDHQKGECKVAIIINGEKYNLPVFHQDECHMDTLNIPVEQVRWFMDEDKVKIEYPENFFGKES